MLSYSSPSGHTSQKTLKKRTEETSCCSKLLVGTPGPKHTVYATGVFAKKTADYSARCYWSGQGSFSRPRSHSVKIFTKRYSVGTAVWRHAKLTRASPSPDDCSTFMQMDDLTLINAGEELLMH